MSIISFLHIGHNGCRLFFSGSLLIKYDLDVLVVTEGDPWRVEEEV